MTDNNNKEEEAMYDFESIDRIIDPEWFKRRNRLKRYLRRIYCRLFKGEKEVWVPLGGEKNVSK